MTLQRRRGQKAVIFPEKSITDRRNHQTIVSDFDNPIPFRGAFLPDRALRAEVPGQQEVDVYAVTTSHDLPGVGMYSTVRWRGRDWDVDGPPAYHHGTRHTRHYTMMIRARPILAPEEEAP